MNCHGVGGVGLRGGGGGVAGWGSCQGHCQSSHSHHTNRKGLLKKIINSRTVAKGMGSVREIFKSVIINALRETNQRIIIDSLTRFLSFQELDSKGGDFLYVG
jgi:hypothetical protein